jgi:ribosomal protein S18 acetylase RimI-like enzyme
MWRIGGIYILKDHQGKGLGTLLMCESLAHLDEDLMLGVDKKNTNAITFYTKL